MIHFVKKNFQVFLNSRFLPPTVLLFVAIIAYGLLIPYLGFYIDDYYIIWYQKVFGTSQLVNYFSVDRPFQSWLFLLTTPIFQESSLAWQIFGLITHWISAVALWLLIKQIWPTKHYLAFCIALIYLVLPGFQQHWLVVLYSHYYLLLVMIIYSYSLLIKGIREKKNSAILFSVILSFYPLFAVEYFLGFELIRVFLIFLIFNQYQDINMRTKIGKTIKTWVPFLFLLLVFLIWRIFFFQSQIYSINLLESVKNAPQETVIKMLTGMLSSFYQICVTQWLSLFDIKTYPRSGSALYFSFMIFFLTFCSLAWVSIKTSFLNNSEEQNKKQKEISEILTFGILLTFLCMVPFKGALLPVTTDFPYDRFLIPLGVGISFVLIGVLAISLKEKALKILVSMLVALSVVVQFNYANTLRRNWNQYSEFLTQLVVRVPDLEKGTTLIANDLPFSQFLPGNDLTASLNWIYGPDKSNSKEIPYYFIIMNSGQSDFYKKLLQDQPFFMNYRTYTFTGDPSKVILVQYNVDSCLTIVNKENMDLLESNKNNAEDFAAFSHLTNLDLINLNSSAKQVPLSSQIKSSQKWCLYYEKASLEAQKGDWQMVIDIYNQAKELSLKPLKYVEWHPLIEAYVYTKNLNEASYLVKDIVEKVKDNKDEYCSYFQNILIESDLYSVSVVSDALSKVGCP